MAQPPPPSSKSMSPPAKGGTGAFIVAVVVMVLLMGGLIFWKLRSSDEPKTVAQTPTPPASTPQIFEEPPPPPPPPPVEEDAGTKQVKKPGVGVPGGGCAGECKGQDSAALRSALAGKAGQARGCYERALRQNAMLQGRLVVSVRVGTQGQVCSAGIAQNSLGDQGVASCVTQMFRSASFPAPQGGCVDAQVPMNFIPKAGSK